MKPPRTASIARLISTLALFASTLGPAAAQAPQPADGAAAARSAVPADTIDDEALIRDHLADIIARTAQTAVRQLGNPQSEHYSLTASLLRAAQTFGESDPEMLRLEIEARAAAGQDDRVNELTRELLRLDPGDEVAQLRIALANIQRRNTADARLDLYERYLGERGAALARSVRSRLALDAALLARDNGSERRFLDYLTLATTLDPSNKQAAALYASHFLALSDDAIERADILSNVVLADPIDPTPYENLGLEMLQRGAFRAARDTLERAFRLYSATGRPSSDRLRFELTLSEWNVSGVEGMLDTLNGIEDATANNMAIRRRDMIAQGLDPGPERPVLLPLDLEQLRLAGAVATRDKELTRRSFEKIAQIRQIQNLQLDEVAGLPEDERPITLERIAEGRLELALQMLWAALFAGVELDTARELLSDLSAATRDDGSPLLTEDAVTRFNAWLLLHEGQPDEARAALEPLAETDPQARWALAETLEQLGQPRDALRAYATLAVERPATAIGSAAWLRAQELHGSPLARPQVARQLDERIGGLMTWLNEQFPGPRDVVTMTLRQEPLAFGPVEGCDLVIEIRNLAPWPVAVGTGRPVPRNLLLTPSVNVGLQDLREAIKPEVIRIPNRLRLDRGETLILRTRPHRRPIGTVLDSGAFQRTTVRWQGTLGFGRTEEGRLASNAISTTATSDIATQRSLGAMDSTESIVEQIRESSGVGLTRAVIRGIYGAFATRGDPNDPAVERRRTSIRDAILARVPTMDVYNRAITLMRARQSNLFRSAQEQSMLRAALAGEGSHLVAVAAVTAGWIDSRDDPLLAVLLDSEDRVAREVGEALDRLLAVAELGRRSGG